MHKTISLVILIFYSLVCHSQSNFDKALTEISTDLAEKLNAKSKKKVVVLYITDINKAPTVAGKYLADILSVNIVNDPRSFDVFDRDNLNEITEAKKLMTEGYINVDEAKELGKILSVEAIVIGSYTVLSNTIKLTLKALDANTGFVIAAAMKDLPLDGDAGALLGINTTGNENNNSNRGFNNVPLNSNEQYNNPGTVSKDCEEKNTGDYCFTNSRKKSLEITLEGKGKFKKLTLDPGQTACFYNLATINWGYSYRVDDVKYKPTYIKGEILIEKCKSKTMILR